MINLTTPTNNPCRYNTKGAREWCNTLKQRWNMKYTILRDSEEKFVITHTSGSGKNSGRILLVGEYCKISGAGYILDRRKTIR
jgi:hypothetical protein